MILSNNSCSLEWNWSTDLASFHIARLRSICVGVIFVCMLIVGKLTCM